MASSIAFLIAAVFLFTGFPVSVTPGSTTGVGAGFRAANATSHTISIVSAPQMTSSGAILRSSHCSNEDNGRAFVVPYSPPRKSAGVSGTTSFGDPEFAAACAGGGSGWGGGVASGLLSTMRDQHRRLNNAA